MTLVAVTRALNAGIVQCELTHLERTPISLEVALAEHEAYERTLSNLGYGIQRIESDESMPDAVFIEDAAIVLDELAIITRPGAESRRGETLAVAQTLARYRQLVHITAPGTLDGGDVLLIGKRLLVGAGARSNESGIAQLRAAVEPHGYTVEALHFTGCLHLKSAVTLVSPDLALVNPEWIAPSALGGIDTMPVHPTEPGAANALLIGTTIVFPEQHVRTQRRLEAIGLNVRSVPQGELAKAEGGVTCCSLLLNVGD